MPFHLMDKSVGFQAQALDLRSHRAEILASNLANADTPNYKARDINFQQLMQRQQHRPIAMHKTNHQHLSIGGGGDNPSALYRVPGQAALDGNTVETHVEKAKFMENSVKYQSTLTFLGGRFKGLKTAIRGEL